MTVPGNIDALLLGGQRGYQIERSLRFNSADSAYLNRTPASNSDSKTWTWSAWVKRGALATEYMVFSAATSNHSSSPTITYLGFNSSDQFVHYSINNSTLTWNKTTSQVFRDVSAWYHIACVLDTSNATAGNRARVYVNGTEVTAWATNTTPSQNADGFVNLNNATHKIGQEAIRNRYSFDGYLTEINFIDGQALTPSSFGETDTITGVWKPKRYSGTYGTNGFYLKFADNSGTTSTTLGKDSSGNGNNWTPNNFSVTAGAGNDSLIDVPTPYADGGNGRGNYPTWNPLDRTAATYSNGNLDVTSTSAASPYNMTSTMRFPATGKWYAEVTLTGLGAGSPGIGIGKNNSDAYAIYRITGAYLTSGMGASTSGTPNTYTTNDVIGIAYDAGAGTLEFYKNGVDQAGNITGITASTEWAIVFRADSASGDAATLNCGQRAFAYTPPSGFLALNTQNLPEPSIKKPSSYFDTKLYTGNGSTQTISGLGFSPDFVWIKCRSAANTHALVDSIRGITKYLVSASTAAEVTDSGGITSLNSDGFSLTFPTSTAPTINANSETYVAWCWDESATPGFDIVTYTGNGATDRTVAHSLGVAPAFFIIKNRTTATDWPVYHKSLPSHDGGNYPTNSLRLNTTGALANTLGLWAAPTSTVITVSDAQLSAGNRPLVNTNGDNYVAYLWSEVAGFSKFGSYTGNGSSDGPFVFTGHRSRWILIKDISTGTTGRDWFIVDTARNTYNVTNWLLRSNLSDAESSYNLLDITSNGFKLRGNDAAVNNSGSTYIFAAFAESPFKYSLAR